jgi:hypothetical protein
VERVGDGTGATAGGRAPPGASGNVSSAAFQQSLPTESRWAAETSGHRSLGGQHRPAGRSDGPQPDIGGGLSGVLLWFPAGAKPASGAGCALGGDHAEEGELGSRRGHARVLRQHEPRVDDEVCRASRCRPKSSTPDPKMAEGGNFRGRELVEDRGRDSAGGQ